MDTTADTDTILGALAILEAEATLTAEQRLAQAWMFEAIEAQFPEITAAMEAWAEDTDTRLTYFEAMLLALPTEVAA